MLRQIGQAVVALGCAAVLCGGIAEAAPVTRWQAR
jgi:hypothetical protein